MAEQQDRKLSKSKGFFGKVSSRKKGKMRHRKAVLDDEESLMCDDKHETDSLETTKIQGTHKSEAVCDTRKCHNGNEESVEKGPTLKTRRTEARPIQRDSTEVICQANVELTDINLCESKADISEELTPENAKLVRVNAIIENNKDNGAKKSLGENEVSFLVVSAELNQSTECLLQSENSAITSQNNNLSISNAETFAIIGEVREVQVNPETGDKYAHKSLVQEHTLRDDNIVDSPPVYEAIPSISTHAMSKNDRRQGQRNKKKTKKMRKSNRKSRNKENFELTADEEISFHTLRSDSTDPETIEILSNDPETKKESKKKRRKKAKRIVKKAGLTVWKGIRTGWKLMWDGLAMYTLPLGSLDVATNITKIWSASSSSSKP